jgi:cytochrome P450
MSSIETFAGSITVADLERDPFPIYRRLRDEAPVCHVPAVELTLVTRWEDVHHVARHPELFTADVGSSPLTRTLGQNMLTVDGAEQRRIRATIDPAMRPRVVAGYAPSVIEPIAERHLAAIEPDGAGELMATYCEPVSVLALGSVMGLGDADADTLRRWFGALALGGSNFESDPDKQAIADVASAEVDDRVLPLLDRLEQEPDGSVLSDMLHTQPPDGERLSKAEVLANLKLILLGGMQEPGHALGIIGGLGHYCVACAMTYAQANVLAPFMYWQMVGAVIVGYLISGTLPDGFTWIGTAIIMAAGLTIAWRETHALPVAEPERV